MEQATRSAGRQLAHAGHRLLPGNGTTGWSPTHRRRLARSGSTATCISPAGRDPQDAQPGEQPEACTISCRLEAIDLILEGEATRVTDHATLEEVARCIVRVNGLPGAGRRFTAPFSARAPGPPPWRLYRFSFHTAFGVATAEPKRRNPLALRPLIGGLFLRDERVRAGMLLRM